MGEKEKKRKFEWRFCLLPGWLKCAIWHTPHEQNLRSTVFRIPTSSTGWHRIRSIPKNIQPSSQASSELQERQFILVSAIVGVCFIRKCMPRSVQRPPVLPTPAVPQRLVFPLAATSFSSDARTRLVIATIFQAKSHPT